MLAQVKAERHLSTLSHTIQLVVIVVAVGTWVALTSSHAINALFLRSARSQGATRVQALRHIFIPGAWPVVLSGLRIGFFITFASVLGGETLSSASGVGHAIAHEGDLLDSPPMFAWIAIVLAVSVGLNLALSLIEKRAGRS